MELNLKWEKHAYVKYIASVKTVIISYLQAWHSSATLLEVDYFIVAYPLYYSMATYDIFPVVLVKNYWFVR